MVDFGNFGKLAQNAVSSVGGDDDKKPEGQDQQAPADGSNWSDVGASAKKAFEDYQSSESKGEKPDYTEVGNVAKQAFSTYNSDKGPKDANTIGKALVSGIFGKHEEHAPAPAQHAEEPKPDAPAPAQTHAPAHAEEQQPAPPAPQGDDQVPN